MNTLNFSIFINASKEKVWDTMLSDKTYREWTKPFNTTSYFVGDWSEGSKILFLDTDEKGENEGGMVAMIKENKPFEYVSLQHLGLIEKGEEKLWEEDKHAFENYSFKEKDGGTEVLIELTNLPEDYIPMMNEMWPKALNVLKELAEK